MSSQTANTNTTSAGHGVRGRWESFRTWRSQRPFAGSVLLILSGLIIGMVPMTMLPDMMFLSVAGKSTAIIGLMFAVFVFLSGVFALRKPELSTELGAVGVGMAILSLIGALGGLLIGMVLGIIGGNLLIAWEDPANAEE